MPKNAAEILDTVRLRFIVSETSPQRLEYDRVCSLGAKLIHLTPQEFLHDFSTWQAGQKDETDELRVPYSGTLARVHGEFNTYIDRMLDSAIGKLESESTRDSAQERQLLNGASRWLRKISADPNLSADNIPEFKLADLIELIIIEYSKSDLETAKEASYLLSGDLNSQKFIDELYDRSQQSHEEPAETDGEYDEILEPHEVSEDAEDDDAVRTELAYGYLEDRLQELAKDADLKRATSVLGREAVTHNFGVVPVFINSAQ